jgi:hypothetical protein
MGLQGHLTSLLQEAGAALVRPNVLQPTELQHMHACTRKLRHYNCLGRKLMAYRFWGRSAGVLK